LERNFAHWETARDVLRTKQYSLGILRRWSECFKNLLNPVTRIPSETQEVHFGRKNTTCQGGIHGAIAAPKTYESNFIHHNFLQFGKLHLRHKAIFPSIVLSQQCFDF